MNPRNQLDLFAKGVPRRREMRFDGETYEPKEDQVRLSGQCLRVFEVMGDGRWHTLSQIARAAEGSEAGVSARLRDLRKVRFGAHTVERRRIAGGLYEYRLTTFPELPDNGGAVEKQHDRSRL